MRALLVDAVSIDVPDEALGAASDLVVGELADRDLVLVAPLGSTDRRDLEGVDRVLICPVVSVLLRIPGDLDVEGTGVCSGESPRRVLVLDHSNTRVIINTPVSRCIDALEVVRDVLGCLRCLRSFHGVDGDEGNRRPAPNVTTRSKVGPSYYHYRSFRFHRRVSPGRRSTRGSLRRLLSP